MKKSQLKAIIRECIEEVVNEGGGSRSRKKHRQKADPDGRNDHVTYTKDKLAYRQGGKAATELVPTIKRGDETGYMKKTRAIYNKQGSRQATPPMADKRGMRNHLQKISMNYRGKKPQKEFDRLRKAEEL